MKWSKIEEGNPESGKLYVFRYKLVVDGIWQYGMVKYRFKGNWDILFPIIDGGKFAEMQWLDESEDLDKPVPQPDPNDIASEMKAFAIAAVTKNLSGRSSLQLILLTASSKNEAIGDAFIKMNQDGSSLVNILVEEIKYQYNA